MRTHVSQEILDRLKVAFSEDTDTAHECGLASADWSLIDGDTYYVEDPEGDLVLCHACEGIYEVWDFDIFDTDMYEQLPEKEQEALAEELDRLTVSGNPKEILESLQGYAKRGLVSIGNDEGIWENGDGLFIGSEVEWPSGKIVRQGE
jgi:hypothetical protein